ncbi:MAG TPA: glycosyltransferase family 2 protein [Bacteroidia bacterium]|jgi:GT2 family glycosyltransferase|nr:glycosyltransferase family 2 protein [Bacteroidia bacterium]
MDGELEITRLREEISKLEKDIQWYKATYENRSLMGIIRDRLYKSFKKYTPEAQSSPLEEKIEKYILSNNLTIRKNKKIDSVSIIMLSYNRIEDTKKAIRNIYKYTQIPFELIILDNNSADAVKSELEKIAEKYDNMKVILETKNLGCAGGRSKATRYAKNNYLLFLDNDLLVLPYYLENLFAQIYKNDQVAGVCCKVVFPDGKIQFNGGKMIVDDHYALYSLHDQGSDFDDENSNKQFECEWIPGGATLWKREIFKQFGIDEEMKGSFEDNEICLRITQAGYKLMNCPAAIVIHDHYDFKSSAFKKSESEYYAGRNNQSSIKQALIHFYNKHHLIFSFAWKNNPWDIIWKLDAKDQILEFIKENNVKE